MKMITVKSSNIESIGYDLEKKQLNVTFKGGKTFGYADVSQQVFDELVSAESVGKHLNKYIKPIKEAFEVLDADTDDAAALKIDVEFLHAQLLLIKELAINHASSASILAVTKETLSAFEGGYDKGSDDKGGDDVEN